MKTLLKRFLISFLILIFPVQSIAVQHDYDIANQTFPNFRADLNNVLSAIARNNDGVAEPSTTFPYMLWADTTANKLKQRNAADNGWVALWDLDSAPGGSVSSALTAFAGGGQGSATLLTDDINQVTTVATAGDSVKLPSAVAGLNYTVINTGANALDVFPNTSDTVDAGAVNIAVSVAVDQAVQFIAQDDTQWHSIGLATGGGGGEAESLSATNAAGPAIVDETSSGTNPTLIPNKTDLDTGIGREGTNGLSLIAGGFQVLKLTNDANGINTTYAINTSLTANAGGGQGSATLLNRIVNHVTTVATAGDSVKLPPAAGGLSVTVINNGANAMDVFPNTSDTINGGSANVAVSLDVDSAATFYAGDATDWYSVGISAGGGGGGAATSLEATNSNGPSIPDIAGGSSTVTLIPNRGSTTTGIAGTTSQLYFRTSGGTRMVLQEANTTIENRFELHDQGGLTAKAGGGQSGATALTTGNVHTVTTVASAGDSVVLPTGFLSGQVHYVINQGANSLDVFPSSSDAINGQAVNTAVSVPVNTVKIFIGASGLVDWYTVP